ncbi:PilZ domain protein [Croceibacterium atlanticum]|uniref:PilZ domain protein n=1 Tax=Croceibacterium atlanticum TaxID=1267766 RepID=A0A0F7KKH2_9SPHN|nr:PilZ domain-containing protein [Croceibacterium atlanticum]AKH41068.1 PilZ domain protein [Croceibacterium atlanticum]
MMLARSQPAVLEPIGDRRRKSRKRLRLQALHTADPQANQEEVLIHDLSETGLLLESSLQLKVGETVQVDLPTLKQVSARIVWQSGKLYGCQFNQPIPRSARSAAILRSPPLERQEALKLRGQPTHLPKRRNRQWSFFRAVSGWRWRLA